MECHDPDGIVAWGLPLPMPRPFDGSDLFEDFFFGRQTNPGYIHRVPNEFWDNGVLDRPNKSTSEDTAIRDPQARDVETDSPEFNQQESSFHDCSAEKIAKTLPSRDNNLPKPGTIALGRPRKELGLLLIVSTNTEEKCITACPDSGSDDNIMSREIAEELGLPIVEIRDPVHSAFVMANGRTVSAVGQVRLKCAFKKGTPATALIDCVFYVLQKLAVPMIMGIEFLHSTGTLTKHRDRLIEELVPPMRALRICSVGRSKREVVCRVSKYVGCATADTGSDVDLVSPSFAASRAFDVQDMCVELEFADGSTGYNMGVIKTTFSIGRVSDVQGFIPQTKEIPLELFILDNLNADIIVGVDTIEDLNAFGGHEGCFVPAIPRLGESDLNIIRYIGAVERGVSRAWDFLKDSFASSKNKRISMSDRRDQKRKRSEQHDQLLHDQLRNPNQPKSVDIPPSEDMTRKVVLQSSLQGSVPSILATSPPDSTDLSSLSLHNSMQNSLSLGPGAAGASAHRPDAEFYYGPGFHHGSDADSGGSVSMLATITHIMDEMRSDAMARQGPVREPAEYWCAFCPDGQHTYPRLDDLQRHVLAQHVDRGNDDALLRETPSQPPDGRS